MIKYSTYNALVIEISKQIVHIINPIYPYPSAMSEPLRVPSKGVLDLSVFPEPVLHWPTYLGP